MSNAPLSTMDAEAIDPEIARFVAELLEGSAGRDSSGFREIASQREAAARGRAVWRQGGPSMRRTLDLSVDLEGRGVRVRLLDPAGDDRPKPALVYLHGGGFTLFSIDTHDRLMREYAARAGVVVMGVDYSLSPEAKFPTALGEVIGVLDWLAEHAAALGLDPDRLAVGGDSAGANLALAACLALRDRGKGRSVRAMLLNYGFFDADFDTASQRRHGRPGALLTTEELASYLENYLGGTSDWSNPLALPALAELHDLPPSLHVIAECDPLADADRRLAERLRSAGSAAEVRVYAGATHSFLEAVSVSALADRALAQSAQWLRDALAPTGPEQDEVRT